MRYFLAVLTFLFDFLLSFCQGFVGNHLTRRQFSGCHSTKLCAGQGFGKKSGPRKTYGSEAAAPVGDIIDIEAAMKDFFSTNDEWAPLFRSLVEGPTVPAMGFIDHIDTTGFEFHESTSPWRRLPAVPTGDAEREILSDFLDSMQTSLLDIPVTEGAEDDDNDLQFLEEGRRLLVCSRFHVVQGMEVNSVESYSNLFSVCWNEIAELSTVDETNTGSIILVPGCELADLRRFADINLHRPLEFLGLKSNFEVASLKRGSPAIRLIHKLEDMPEVQEQ